MHKQISKTWLYASIALASSIGTLSHFLYDWTDEAKIIGIFVPINESVWEHLKMIYWPHLGLGIAGWFVFRKQHLRLSSWFYAVLLAILFAQYVLLSGHYLFVGITGKESVIFDIFLFLLAVICGHLLASKYYQKAKAPPLLFTVFALLILALLFLAFTFRSPNLPLFQEIASDLRFLNGN
jgi:hypothetical protein